MSYFQQSRWQVWMFIALVALNLTSLGMIWVKQLPKETVHKNRRLLEDRRRQADQFLIDQLAFDQKQREQFIELSEIHVLNVRNIREHLMNSKRDFFSLLEQSEVDSVQVTELSQQVANLQAKLEQSTFYHFKAIRAIGTLKQQQKFDYIILDVFKMLDPIGGRKPPSEFESRSQK